MKDILARDLPLRGTLVVLALALVASLVTGQDRAPTLATSQLPQAGSSGSQPLSLPELSIEKLVRERGEQQHVEDLFATYTSPPPPVPAAPSAPTPVPAPQQSVATPPLPFKYLGRMVRGGRAVVYVLKGDDMLLVEAPGQKVGDYQVESINDSAVTFLFIPTETRQALAFPARD